MASTVEKATRADAGEDAERCMRSRQDSSVTQCKLAPPGTGTIRSTVQYLICAAWASGGEGRGASPVDVKFVTVQYSKV